MKIGDQELVFSKILIKNKLATPEQVRECVYLFEQQTSPGEPLEKFFLDKGYLSKEQLKKAKKATERTLRLFQDIVYAKLAEKKGFVTEEQLQKCFSIQKAGSYRMSLGELFLLKDYISEKQHAEIQEELKRSNHRFQGDISSDDLKEKGNDEGEEKKAFNLLKFGEMALKRLLVTSEQISECLQIQKEMRLRGIEKKLGEVMMEKNYINEIQVQKIISALQESEGQSKLIESYIIHEKLGEGAMGVVFKAFLEGTSEPIALKVLRPYIAESRDTLKRFAEEAKKAIALNHPNIVRAFEVGVSDEYYYYTMEYVEGENLREILDREQFLSIKLSVKIIKDVASALGYAAERQIIHRDIKPDNIILQRDGTSKLCDMGIAKDLQVDSNLTQTGMVVGTPYYISPEMAKGKKDIDHRSDLYSLGATFYKMITGRVPFDGETATSVLVQHLTAAPIAPEKIRPEVSVFLSKIILRLLEKKPENRFQSASELIDSLNRIL